MTRPNIVTSRTLVFGALGKEQTSPLRRQAGVLSWKKSIATSPSSHAESRPLWHCGEEGIYIC